MCKKLIQTENAEINQTKIDLIKEIFSRLQKTVDYVPKDKAYKIEENKQIMSLMN